MPNSIAAATMQWSATDDRRHARSHRADRVYRRRPRARRRIRVIMDIAMQRLIIRVGDFPGVSAAAWAAAVQRRIIQRTAFSGVYFSLVFDQRAT
jgi:hypothetical protein